MNIHERIQSRPRVLSIVLAGGEGNRLRPLTRDRAKPAVPFGGQYRLIDFALSNLVNAGMRRIVVLTQYKSHSLDRHLAQTWRLSSLLNNYITPVPAQMRVGPRWFSGSADAIFQNLNIIGDEDPNYVIVTGSDHIYRMDLGQMLSEHMSSKAGVTIAAIPVPIETASDFGVIEADSQGKILRFLEKPEIAPPMVDNPAFAFASMGNYVFSRPILEEAVRSDSDDPDSNHDIGGDIIPKLVDSGQAFVYDFAANTVPGQTVRERGYWRDVGSLDSYYQASMDLTSVDPVFDLYNPDWPIFSYHYPLPPAKFVFDSDRRRGHALDSLVSSGVIISGGSVRRSILSPRVRIHSYSSVEESVLFDDVDVGRGAIIRRAIIDKGVKVPADYEIGVDPSKDAEHFVISEDGIVVIGKKDLLD